MRVLSEAPFKDYPVSRAGTTYEVNERELSELLQAAGFAIAGLKLRQSVREMASAEDAIRQLVWQFSRQPPGEIPNCGAGTD